MVIDLPSSKASTAKAVAEFIKWGYRVERVTVEESRRITTCKCLARSKADAVGAEQQWLKGLTPAPEAIYERACPPDPVEILRAKQEHRRAEEPGYQEAYEEYQYRARLSTDAAFRAAKEAQQGRKICVASSPAYDDPRHALHPYATEVGNGDEVAVYKCPICLHTWSQELPQ